MAVLLLDVETTGLDPKKDRIIEIGAMVVNNNFTSTNEELSILVWGDDYPEVTPEIQKITGIKPEELARLAVTPKQAMTQLSLLVGPNIGHVIAFNAEFDRGFIVEEMHRQDLIMDPRLHWLAQDPWLCAMRDIESNYEHRSQRLAHLALEYGVTVNPNELHRAINDVELMRKLLAATGTTIESITDFKNEPWVYLLAEVKPPWTDNGESTGKAKALGYSFERAKGDDSRSFTKSWVKRVKARNVEKERAQAQFKIVVME